MNQSDKTAVLAIAMVALLVRFLWNEEPAMVKAAILFVGWTVALSIWEHDHRREVLANPGQAQRQLCWWRLAFLFRPAEDAAKRGAAVLAFVAAEVWSAVCYGPRKHCAFGAGACVARLWFGIFVLLTFTQLLIFVQLQEMMGAREQPQVPAPAPATEATPLLAARQQRAPPAPPAPVPANHAEAKVDGGGDADGQRSKGAAAVSTNGDDGTTNM